MTITIIEKYCDICNIKIEKEDVSKGIKRKIDNETFYLYKNSSCVDICDKCKEKILNAIEGCIEK